MGDPERNMGFTTTCSVGVDLETMTVLFQSTVTSFGLLTDCASTEPEKKVAANRRRERALNRWIKLLSAIADASALLLLQALVRKAEAFEGAAPSFWPMYAWANIRHPSREVGFVNYQRVHSSARSRLQ